ncbi:MAG: metalloregulator ArsR/SmtB family transcription factor [Aristaeellaceae bacterium]
MTEQQVLALFKCLADKSRLQILKSLAQEDMYVEHLAQRLGLTPSTISFHLKKLAEAGAVKSYKTQYYTMYALEKSVFMTTILDLIREKSEEEDLQRQRDEAYRKKVLDTFFEYGKLKSIPMQKKKERIVLEELVKSFEYGRTYTEREVNIILADFNDDFCTLRRDLIGEGLMARSMQTYWRLDPSDNRDSK